jgi:chitosanase
MELIQKETCWAIVNIFETGKVRGEYGAVAVIKGDKGHLSYGRSQLTLDSGHLFNLVNQYCSRPDARFANDLKQFLTKLQERNVALDTDENLKTLLVRAGREDPVMQNAQDSYFDRNFFTPACLQAESFGVTLPLGYAVVYDSHVQGGWGILAPRIGKVNARGEKDWIGQYVQMRRDWLSEKKPPLPATVYRMDSFKVLIKDENWSLNLPIKVHGVTITREALIGADPAGAATPRILRLTTPYLRGADVDRLQQALSGKGMSTKVDGVYGPFTDVLVKKWQESQQIKEDGVGPLTWKSLELQQTTQVAPGP